MKTWRDPDAVLVAWLEAGPRTLPEASRQAIAEAARSIPQERVSSRRFRVVDAMTRFHMLGVTAAVVMIAVLGAVSIARPPQPPPGVDAPSPPSPSEPPSPSPSGPHAMDQAFISTVHWYSARFPDGWSARASTEAWGGDVAWIGDETWGSPVPIADRFSSPGPNDWIWVASTVIPEETSVEQWMTNMLPPRRRPNGICLGTSGGLFGQPSEEWRPAVIGLRPGVRRSACGFIDGLVVIGHRAWVISYRGAALPESVAPGGRAIFDAFAATVTFEPDVVPSPSLAPASVIPDQTFTSDLYGYSIRVPGT